MFFRVKSAGSYQYLQIVHSVRQGENVRQQVFGTLGRLDELKASGRLEALIRSGLRHCEKFALIDAHAAGETQAVTVQRIGPDLVFGRLWKECGIQEVIQSLLQARRYDFDVERAIYLTVLHRLFASGSDRAAERWREDYLIAGTEALDLHHLYRAMAFLGQEIESRGQKTLGGVVSPNRRKFRQLGFRLLQADLFGRLAAYLFSRPLHLLWKENSDRSRCHPGKPGAGRRRRKTPSSCGFDPIRPRNVVSEIA
jgi:hypothetical protein